MQIIWVFMAAGALFAFGYYIMGRVDRFLGHGEKEAPALPLFDKSFRIGFSDPLLADSIAGALESFEKAQQNVSVSLFSGTAEELLREFSQHKLDVVFLPVDVAVPGKTHYNVGKVSLDHIPVTVRYSGRVIGPVTEGGTVQKVLWEEDGAVSAAASFIRCLKSRTDWRNRDGSSKAGPGPAFARGPR